MCTALRNTSVPISEPKTASQGTICSKVSEKRNSSREHSDTQVMGLKVHTARSIPSLEISSFIKRCSNGIIAVIGEVRGPTQSESCQVVDTVLQVPTTVSNTLTNAPKGSDHEPLSQRPVLNSHSSCFFFFMYAVFTVRNGAFHSLCRFLNDCNHLGLL